MRSRRHRTHSPRLALQLLLVLLLVCAIGGTGLVGLHMARNAVTEIAATRMVALGQLLEAEREVVQLDASVSSAGGDTGPLQRALQPRPALQALAASAARHYSAFEALSLPAPGQAALRARITTLFHAALTSAAGAGQGQAQNLDSAATGPPSGTLTSSVAPLLQDLIQLALLQESATRDAGSAAASLAQTVSVLLFGVIVLALLVIGIFQLTLGVREHRRLATAPHSGDLVVFLDAAGMIRSVSTTCEWLLGYQPTQLEKGALLDLIHPGDQELLSAALTQRVRREGTVRDIEFRVRHTDGSYRWLAATMSNRLRDPLIRSIVLTGRDVTARQESEVALAFQASHDQLTGLPNRPYLLERLKQALDTARNGGQSLALLLLDLDRFKEVNDTLGHHAGDMLLQFVAQRLASAVRAGDVVARLGGDEYAVLLPAAGQPAAMLLAGRLSTVFEEPFVLEEETLEIGVSIGIALYPEHGQDPLLLLQHADVAMYGAKRDHLPLVLYDPQRDQHSLRHLAVLRDLRLALQQDQLRLYYQPKVELGTHQLRGVEALLRWSHPTHGFIPPDQFIPLAEQTGLIGPLTDWVLETALRQCKRWQDAGCAIPVAVNLSARVLHDPQLPERISRMLAHHGLMPSCLTLEITETGLMADPARAKTVLTSLNTLGVKLSIDDFGTGYSSLGYLKALPVHELKVDKSFVLGMSAHAPTKDAAIVRSVIAMAHALELTVVAEGVEDAQAQAALKELACDTIQGYYVCRPVPPAELEQRLHDTDQAFGAIRVAAGSLLQVRPRHEQRTAGYQFQRP